MRSVPDRSVLLICHAGRPAAIDVAAQLIDLLSRGGIRVLMPPDELARVPGDAQPVDTPEDLPGDCDLVVVVGGDGTILRAAEWARHADAPLLGVNLGHVGFLAEAEPDDVGVVAEAVVGSRYAVERRTALDVRIATASGVIWHSWALNEASVEKVARERMIDLFVEIDGRPLSRWACDGILCATPTGSTAYAWSAGGPVVWPGVDAMIVVPLSAHALFARPLVTSPTSRIALELPAARSNAVVWCDGRRSHDVPSGARVEITASDQHVKFARLHPTPFTDRLVRKFDLPVHGWRGEPGT